METDREDDFRIFDEKRKTAAPIVKATLLPKVLRLEVRSAPAIININLSDLLSTKSPYQASDMNDELDGTTLVSNDDASQVQAAEDLTLRRLNPDYASFLELEPELRNRIYRELLVNDKVVKFAPGMGCLSRTSALLRTCHQVHEEARGILYGENAFHIDRRNATRGNYWAEEWKEIGYKDARRFLETIGPNNVARMRFLSMRLEDAAPFQTPKLDAPERRYQNDPVLHHVLRLIGNSGVVLERFVVAYSGRAELTHDDAPFVRAFTSIKTRKLIKHCGWGHSKVNYFLYIQMVKFMKAPRLEDVDIKRRRVPKMEWDNLGVCNPSCFNCRKL